MNRPDPVSETREFTLRQTIRLAEAVHADAPDEDFMADATHAAWIAYRALTKLAEIDPEAAHDVAEGALINYETWAIPSDARLYLAELTKAPAATA